MNRHNTINTASRFPGKGQQGFNLIELMIVIGLVALAIMIGFSIYNAANEKNKVSNFARDLGAIASGIVNTYATSPSYNGLSNTVIMAGNTIPSHMRGTGTNIKSPWSLAGVTIAPTNADQNFQITVTDIPDGSCQEITSQTFSTYDSVTANGTAVTNPTTAATACAAGANTVVWVSH